MDFLPHDPAILVSAVNMLLRDEEFDSLESLCYNFNQEPEQLKAYLLQHGFVFSTEQLQFRPVGYDGQTIKAGCDEEQVAKSALQIAYAFFHQKLQVYAHSTMAWQRDDIEVAIADYVGQMNKELYRLLAGGRQDYLITHSRFEEDLRTAVEQLEKLLF